MRWTTWSAGQAIVVRGADQTLWLVAGGRRYTFDAANPPLLELRRAVPVPLPAAVLDVLPEGSPITPPSVASRGLPVPGLRADWLVGSVLRVDGGGAAQSFVVLDDGVAPVSEFTAGLLVASGSATIRTDAADVGAAPLSQRRLDLPGWPATVPTIERPQREQPVCFSTTPGDPPGDAPWTVRVSLPGSVPTGGEQPVFTHNGDIPGAVDEVIVRRGSGAVVRAGTSSGGDGALTLVTDSGQRFAIPTRDAATRLRYDPDKARPVPAPFVRLLPAGPALDPELAAHEFAGR